MIDPYSFAQVHLTVPRIDCVHLILEMRSAGWSTFDQARKLCESGIAYSPEALRSLLTRLGTKEPRYSVVLGLVDMHRQICCRPA